MPPLPNPFAKTPTVMHLPHAIIAKLAVQQPSENKFIVAVLVYRSFALADSCRVSTTHAR